MPSLNDLDVFSETMFPGASPEELLCTEEEVLHLLQTINISKASGPNRISGKMLKATALRVRFKYCCPCYKDLQHIYFDWNFPH